MTARSALRRPTAHIRPVRLAQQTAALPNLRRLRCLSELVGGVAEADRFVGRADGGELAGVRNTPAVLEDVVHCLPVDRGGGRTGSDEQANRIERLLTSLARRTPGLVGHADSLSYSSLVVQKAGDPGDVP